jgi:hypothetical protein
LMATFPFPKANVAPISLDYPAHKPGLTTK